jgi:hypothetical protein
MRIFKLWIATLLFSYSGFATDLSTQDGVLAEIQDVVTELRSEIGSISKKEECFYQGALNGLILTLYIDADDKHLTDIENKQLAKLEKIANKMKSASDDQGTYCNDYRRGAAGMGLRERSYDKKMKKLVKSLNKYQKTKQSSGRFIGLSSSYTAVILTSALNSIKLKTIDQTAMQRWKPSVCLLMGKIQALSQVTKDLALADSNSRLYNDMLDVESLSQLVKENTCFLFTSGSTAYNKVARKLKGKAQEIAQNAN